jgi:pSer/pThr/pTyr-binding forkhead associated (FHA) protein
MIYLFHVTGLNYYEIKGEFKIGRTQGDLVIGTDSLLSSLHVKIYPTEINSQIQIFVEDLGSKNKSMLNRTELTPNNPVKASINSVLEIGCQKFIFTKNNRLQILEINQILESNEQRIVTKIEGQKLIDDLKTKIKSELTNLVALEEKYKKEAANLEAKVLEFQNLINQYLEKEKIEHEKLEEQKRKISFEIQNKASELKQNIASVHGEINSIQEKIQDIRSKKAEKELRITTFGKKRN